MSLLGRVLIAASTVVGVAGCGISTGEVASTPSGGTPALSRAEVRADLTLWRQSGMHKFYQGRQRPDVFSARYQASHAKYIQLKNGPEYAEEVRRQQLLD